MGDQEEAKAGSHISADIRSHTTFMLTSAIRCEGERKCVRNNKQDTLRSEMGTRQNDEMDEKSLVGAFYGLIRV